MVVKRWKEPSPGLGGYLIQSSVAVIIYLLVFGGLFEDSGRRKKCN